jgi:hypothetical protein
MGRGSRDTPPVQRTIRALFAVLALADGCGQSSSAKISVTFIQTEAGVDASDGSSAPNTMARCCALMVADAGGLGDAGDAATSKPTDNCSVLTSNGFGVIEPCLTGNSGGTYGSWTCGRESPETQCGDNGLSCNLGDPCTLRDVGCAGVVQACTFTPYTPPPAPSDSGAG